MRVAHSAGPGRGCAGAGKVGCSPKFEPANAVVSEIGHQAAKECSPYGLVIDHAVDKLGDKFRGVHPAPAPEPRNETMPPSFGEGVGRLGQGHKDARLVVVSPG